MISRSFLVFGTPFSKKVEHDVPDVQTQKHFWVGAKRPKLASQVKLVWSKTFGEVWKCLKC